MYSCPVCKKRHSQFIGRDHRQDAILACKSCGWQFKLARLNVQPATNSQELTKKSPSVLHSKPAKPRQQPVPPPAKEFYNLLGVVCLLNCLPVINWPLEILETFFHELCHAIVILALGGRVDGLIIHISGGFIYGYWANSGSAFAAFAGYAGASLLGMLVYRRGLRSTPKGNLIFVFSLVLGIGLATVFWVRDAFTVQSLLATYVIFSLSLIGLQKKKWVYMLNTFLKISGLYSVTTSLITPIYCLIGGPRGDALDMQKQTHIPAELWVLLWMGIAWIALAYMFTWTQSRKSRASIPQDAKNIHRKRSRSDPGIPAQAGI